MQNESFTFQDFFSSKTKKEKKMVKKSMMVSTNSSPSEEILQQDHEEFLCLSLEEEEENGLTYWEFVNASDADDDDIHIDFDNVSLDSHENGLFVSLHSSLSSSITIPPKSHIESNTHFDDQQEVGQGHTHVGFLGYVGYDDDGDCDDDEGMFGDDDDMYDDDDDDYYGDGYDLDDELVPRAVRGKLGRQRMRKLGKRGFARMYNSKKSPLLYTKPGCVHGKHGLGLKHCC